MKARTPSLFAPRWIILILLVGFALPALGQNTKGDRPAVNNERKIRETKSKTVKKRDKAKTKDIAGRRLRTKDKSSANRANAGIRQPDPYLGRPRVTGDRAAKPRGRVYSERPTEKPRVNRGDIAGHPIRTTKPRRTEAARANIHPQSGRYVRLGATGDTGDRPYKYKETASGRPIIHRLPQQKERAWKGDIKGRPFTQPRSITSKRENTFPQDYMYSRYVRRKVQKDRAISNQRETSQAKQLSRKPKTSGPGGGYVSAGNKGFVKRGRKNVYWGKFSKGEKPVTTDLTGAPLRKKNYRSPAAGLVGRDTLQHFGRRPRGDVSFAGERPETPGVKSSPSGKGWQGDISGRRLRSQRSPGRAGHTYGGYRSASKPGGVGKPIPPKGGGLGALALAEGTRRMKGGSTKAFTPQGEGFSGFMKVQRRKVGYDVGSYSGNMQQTKTFSDQGEGYTGNIKVSRRRVGYDVGSFSGNMRQTKTFSNQGEGFSGYTKTRPQAKGGGSVSGKLWNNNGTAIASRNLPASAELPGLFSGNLRARQKGYTDQGEEFTGYIKSKRPAKGGGSVSGQLWNNRNQPIEARKGYTDQGEEFTGYIKARKPLKGGGSVSGQLWNNDNTALQRKTLPGAAEKPGLFSGNLKVTQKAYADQGEEFTGYIKTRKPEKGGGSVSGKLWNNDGSSITDLSTKSESIAASRFGGRSKTSNSKPSRSGFDDEGKARLKEAFTQSPKAVDESTKKHKPERVGFQAEGLQIRVAKKDYDKREHTVRGALPGEGPNRGSIRASQFASGFRVTADKRKNPNSADEALKGTYYGGRTTAQLGAFHGNVKVKKFDANRKLHPDAKFAHGPDNNVDEERTFFTNMKLWWTKLFHDSESQPTNVKEKERRPRYDKGEKGMWAE